MLAAQNLFIKLMIGEVLYFDMSTIMDIISFLINIFSLLSQILHLNLLFSWEPSNTIFNQNNWHLDL